MRPGDRKCAGRCPEVAISSITLVCPRDHIAKVYLCHLHMVSGSSAIARAKLNCDECGGRLEWRQGISR